MNSNSLEGIRELAAKSSGKNTAVCRSRAHFFLTYYEVKFLASGAYGETFLATLREDIDHILGACIHDSSAD